MRNNVRYEIPKQNGTLITRIEADSQIDYYDFPPPPPAAHVVLHHIQPPQNETLPPPPLSVQFQDFDGRDGIQVEMLPQYVEYMTHKDKAFENEYNVRFLSENM